MALHDDTLFPFTTMAMALNFLMLVNLVFHDYLQVGFGVWINKQVILRRFCVLKRVYDDHFLLLYLDSRRQAIRMTTE